MALASIELEGRVCGSGLSRGSSLGLWSKLARTLMRQRREGELSTLGALHIVLTVAQRSSGFLGRSYEKAFNIASLRGTSS